MREGTREDEGEGEAGLKLSGSRWLSGLQRLKGPPPPELAKQTLEPGCPSLPKLGPAARPP